MPSTMNAATAPPSSISAPIADPRHAFFIVLNGGLTKIGRNSVDRRTHAGKVVSGKANLGGRTTRALGRGGCLPERLHPAKGTGR